jgi:hypothetical protein
VPRTSWATSSGAQPAHIQGSTSRSSLPGHVGDVSNTVAGLPTLMGARYSREHEREATGLRRC